jgi:hypothetical protein
MKVERWLDQQWSPAPGGRRRDFSLSGAVDCDLEALTGKPRLSGALTVHMHVEALPVLSQR